MMKKERKWKPSSIAYGVIGKEIARLYCFLYRIEKRRVELPEQAIYLCNHASNIDFFPLIFWAWPKRLNFVMSDYFVRNRFLTWLARVGGVVTKPQFHAQIRYIYSFKEIIEEGGSLAIYPSGLSSYDGRGTYIPISIAKLVKLFNIPVVCMKIQGSYATFPKWNMRFIRKGTVRFGMQCIIEPKEIEEMSLNDLYKKIVHELEFDAFDWAKKESIVSLRKINCKGIERILYKCPKCLEEFKFITKANELYCEACGEKYMVKNDWSIIRLCNDLHEMVFSSPSEWNSWQNEMISKNLMEGKVFSGFGVLYPFDDIRNKYKCEYMISKDKITISKSNGEKMLEIDNGSDYSILCESLKHIEIWKKNRLYILKPSKEIEAFKIANIHDVAYKLKKGHS